MQLVALDTAQVIDDLEIPGYRLHPLKAQSGISPEMALRLSKALGRSPESWLAKQHAYDLWLARKNLSLATVSKIKLDAA